MLEPMPATMVYLIREVLVFSSFVLTDAVSQLTIYKKRNTLEFRIQQCDEQYRKVIIFRKRRIGEFSLTTFEEI